MPGKKAYVTFWGTRGSIPTPGHSTEKYGGNTSCVSVEHGKTHLIFDAGTGIRDLGIQLMKRLTEDGQRPDLHLLLSHTHWDHIQGLPFFEPAYAKATKMVIYGSPKRERFLEAILQHQMDVTYFPVEMNALAADISIQEMEDRDIEIGQLSITWQEQVCHPGGSIRYRINAGSKKIVYATDIELNKLLAPDADAAHKTLAKEYCEFIEGADLLIADGQYTQDEYPTRVNYGHTSIPLLLETAARAHVQQLAIFHHEPRHTDSDLDKLWATIHTDYLRRDPPMNVFFAREGMTLAV